MKTLLGDPTMTKRMLEVEKDSITDAILRKLKKYTESPKFVPDEASLLNIYRLLHDAVFFTVLLHDKD